MNEAEAPCPVVGRVCWPTELTVDPGVAHASRLVCAHPEHQERAAQWVESVTGHRGVFVEVPADA